MLSGGAMRAILVREPGDERVLFVGDAPRPPLGAADVRIRVRTAGVNRADLMPRLGHLAPGETALVHGGGGGVGTAAIRLLREAGHRVIVTAGSEAKCRRCLELGATAAIDYRTEDFAARARELTGGRGVDVVLDHIGARYLAANLAALAPGGRLVEIGLMGGAAAELNLAQLLLRRLAVPGSTLRSRSNEDKAAIVEAFRARFGAALARGVLRPVVDRVLPIEPAAAAHRLMQASEHFGKIVLRIA